ncbi:MAG: hypothetical protein AABY22_00050 [Nanoarchaeota archaeon]
MKEEPKNQCCVSCRKEHPDDEMGCRFDFDCPCHQPEPKKQESELEEKDNPFEKIVLRMISNFR